MIIIESIIAARSDSEPIAKAWETYSVGAKARYLAVRGENGYLEPDATERQLRAWPGSWQKPRDEAEFERPLFAAWFAEVKLGSIKLDAAPSDWAPLSRPLHPEDLQRIDPTHLAPASQQRDWREDFLEAGGVFRRIVRATYDPASDRLRRLNELIANESRHPKVNDAETARRLIAAAGGGITIAGYKVALKTDTARHRSRGKWHRSGT